MVEVGIAARSSCLPGLRRGTDCWIWGRYNSFYVLYPLGIASEVWLMYKALEPAGRWNLLCEYFLKAAMLVYIPGSDTPLGLEWVR